MNGGLSFDVIDSNGSPLHFENFGHNFFAQQIARYYHLR